MAVLNRRAHRFLLVVCEEAKNRLFLINPLSLCKPERFDQSGLKMSGK